MVAIYRLPEILASLPAEKLIRTQEEAFIAYSRRSVTLAPVGHLRFDNPKGDCHIKSGYVFKDTVFVVKVATGFYGNVDSGLPSSNGLMLVFNRRTGAPEAILLDEGYLTDLRTAAAGAIAAKYLARKPVHRIGMIGTGTQARLQLKMLRNVTPCRDVVVWGRNPARTSQYCVAASQLGFNITSVSRPDEIAAHCDLIVTATPSTKPLLFADQIRPGTHITAVGADAAGKQELDAAIFGRADVCCVDSVEQCSQYGDASHALRMEIISKESLVELGRVIEQPGQGRSGDHQITLADLTGVAVQDVQIAKVALEAVEAVEGATQPET